MPLILACKKGHGDIVKLLLSYDNVEPYFGDNKGCMALSWAAYKGYEAVVELLLVDERIDKNIQDYDGLTPLIWVAQKFHELTVRLLVRHGCQICDLDEDSFVFHAALFISDDGF
ncbi:ankyrin repeat-containing domain protein [Hypoxylon trugodes]|uniref:ankyrin repeat-containing domain protein n=1 Tax=Hypoxylon trugodes TaxID=326681 RepID=UPI0021915978|nr:ankyrin repeat-containing domain protein [Hypoxylon trugodes]KAI1384140.1 ankyrin repeat-containing domain protein [Hypoxylon trugodes]